ncbi:hypothetical protein CONLIGDRAFT_685865 [Coniochaeta ligniaria NRRL 30616]|uniref:Uncharacterized protein n=1 Tax=Coniochaeta ligniaria NRRL 30616 TaxID=1408157 RepID=A0A1J7I9W8_9PEZI|nr:hypothetical protein CONLIGDRAFT_685865 [Coniochaeta ligniaria NRRL 30616]
MPPGLSSNIDFRHAEVWIVCCLRLSTARAAVPGDTFECSCEGDEAESLRDLGRRAFLALTSIVDLVGEDMEDGTVGTCWRGVSAVKAAPFAISKNAKRKFGVVATTRETRRSRTDGFKAAPAALQQRVVDEQEEQRKVWEKHERQPEAQVTRSRHWRQISIIATRSTCLVPLHQL